MSTPPPEPFVPASKDDWAEVFANGIALDRSRREEADAKAKAAQSENDKGNGSGDNGDSKPRSLAERILGSIH